SAAEEWVPAFAGMVSKNLLIAASSPIPSLGAAPKPLRRNRRPLDHRTQLFERDVRVELAVTGKGAKAAIAAGDHPLAPDDVGELADALGDELGMLDIIGRGIEHSRYQDLVVGQPGLPPYRPFMRMPRVG